MGEKRRESIFLSGLPVGLPVETETETQLAHDDSNDSVEMNSFWKNQAKRLMAENKVIEEVRVGREKETQQELSSLRSDIKLLCG